MQATADFTAWAIWFKEFHNRQMSIDWSAHDRVPAKDWNVIAASIAQFQLGESSEAKNLKAKVARFVKRGGNAAYQQAIEWFIFEENRHSKLLGKFMDLEGMPRTTMNVADKLFRVSRHSVTLLYAHLILLSAEIIAFPYYRALKNATESPILKAICTQILRDEVTHIRFQAATIRMLQSVKSQRRVEFNRVLARLMLSITIRVVWYSHRRLFKIGGYDFTLLRRESRHQFHHVWGMILEPHASLEPAISA